MSEKIDNIVEDLREQLMFLAGAVRHLSDCEAIRQAMYAYARGVDRADQDLIASIFHDDAIDDHGNFSGDKTETLAALKRSAAVRETTASFHQLGNILIDLRGDAADVETYFVAVQRRESGKTFTRIRAGRYLDHFVKRNGDWRILRRKVIDDWSRLDEVVATAGEVGPDNHHGTRDHNDPSFAVKGFMDNRKARNT